MITVGAFEAKANFSQLLNKVMNGETVIIIRHGQEIAQLVRIGFAKARENNIQKTINNIRCLRKGIALGNKLSVKRLKVESRK